MKELLKPTKDIVVTVDDELKPLIPEVSYIVKEFTSYKTQTLLESNDNFVTPNEYLQQQYPSSHNLFGRDRVFDYPIELSGRIHLEKIAHVHYNINDYWESVTKQWDCKSNSSVVYSGFETLDTYHFIIHELLLTDAHSNYSNEDIEYYLNNAEYHRKVLNKKS